MNWLHSRQQSYGQPQGDQQVPPYSQPQRLKKPRTMSVKVNVAFMGAVALLLAAIISSCGLSTTSSSTPTPTPSSTPTPIPSPTPPPPTITSPTEGSSVPKYITVDGTASNIPPGKELWLLVESEGVNGYFPQGDANNPSPIVVSSDGKWNVGAYIGQDTDVGREFVLYVALVDQKGRAAIDQYFASGRAGHGYKPLYPLPEGIQLISQVRVLRK